MKSNRFLPPKKVFVITEKVCVEKREVYFQDNQMAIFMLVKENVSSVLLKQKDGILFFSTRERFFLKDGSISHRFTRRS